MKYTKREVLKATTLQRKLVTDYRQIQFSDGPRGQVGQWMLGGRNRKRLPEGFQRKALLECPETKPTPEGLCDLTGRTYGELKVVGFHSAYSWDENPGYLIGIKWVIQCSCGKYEVRKQQKLASMHKKSKRCIECQAEHWMHEQDCYVMTGYFPEDLYEQTGRAWEYEVNGRKYVRDGKPHRMV